MAIDRAKVSHLSNDTNRFVTLRVKAADGNGGTVESEVHRAYILKKGAPRRPAARGSSLAPSRRPDDDYQQAALPDGWPSGTPEDALDTACGLYLGDPTAWLTNPRRTSGDTH